MDWKYLISSIIALVILVGGAWAEAAPDSDATVSRISVNLRLEGSLPGPLKDRISESISKVGEKALLGKKLSEAKTLEASLSQVMKKIFSEVLSGFEVLDLGLKLDSHTVINVYLECQKPAIEYVVIDVVPREGIHPKWKELFKQKMEGLEEELTAELAGVPVESKSWSEPLIESIIRERVKSLDGFIGFQLITTTEMGPELLLRVEVNPDAPTIRRAALKMRSFTIPALALERIKYTLARHTDFLLGMPIEFAAEHRDFVEEEFRDLLADIDLAQNLKLEYDFRMTFQSHTLVSVIAESEKYRGFARVKVSLGEEDRNPDAEGHLGIYLFEDTEFFSEFNFLPGPISFQFNLGVGRRIGRFDIAAGRNVIDGLDRIWLNAHVTEDIILSWERNVVETEDKEYEGSITFRAHDFFSVELVSDCRDDLWLRFSANL